MLRALLVGVAVLAVAVPTAVADHGGGGDVRVAGTCSRGATSGLRLKTEDDGIEVRFELEQRRPTGPWSVKLVHERRVVWKTTARTTSGDRSFELRRTLPDLPGSDTVSAQAWGPGGATCRATATLS
jgi:hypothetical protein